MNAPLYNSEILKLAAATAELQPLDDAMARVEKRSPICGSRVTVDVNLDADGRVRELGMKVRACALGQASSTLLARNVMGKSVEELTQARDALAGWLAGGAGPPDWPGLEIFTPALSHSARHASIRLAFEAAAEAAMQARQMAPREKG